MAGKKTKASKRACPTRRKASHEEGPEMEIPPQVTAKDISNKSAISTESDFSPPASKRKRPIKKGSGKISEKQVGVKTIGDEHWNKPGTSTSTQPIYCPAKPTDQRVIEEITQTKLSTIGKGKTKKDEIIRTEKELHEELFRECDDELYHSSTIESDSEEEDVPQVITESLPQQMESSPRSSVSDTEGQGQAEEKWSYEPPEQRLEIPFSGRQNLTISPETFTPFGFFSLIFSTSLIEYIVTQMNNYAPEVLMDAEGPESRISRWSPTSVNEFKTFLAIHFHMGIIRLNRITDYWKRDYRLDIPFFRRYMSKNRYLLLLRVLHFCNNQEDDGTDKIFKIRPIFEFFNRRMDEVYSAGKRLSLDESMVLWRGRLSFRQYIKNKRHKYGFKLYVLAEPNGLVQRLLIYGGMKDRDIGGKRHADKVVNTLMAGKEGKGHSLYMDSYYNSVALAEALLKNKTYCTGTLGKKRQGNPTQVTEAGLKRGDSISMYTKEGICVTKWKDKRDVLCLSSEFTGDLVNTTNRRGCVSRKPELIVEYNNYMKGVDRQDQLLSYYPGCHKTLRWYKKLGLHIFQIILINSHLLYNSFRGVNEKFSLYDFRLQIVEDLIGGPPTDIAPTPRARIHLPSSCPKDAKGKTIRRRCKYCWDTSKVRNNCLFYCMDCPTQPGLCIPNCFRAYHNYN